jgi:alginate O-acetyltransferase complex protein AlgI
VFLAYSVIPAQQIRIKNYLLILASLFFYAFGEPVYVLLMLGSTVFNYLFGRLIARDLVGNKRRAKIALAAAILVNLAFLGVFKYAGMFVLTADTILGLSLQIPVVALPIGISFYTFQAISYLIDVYRSEVQASRSYAQVLLYISFFPQLTAGPIIKYHDVEKQLSRRKAGIEDIAQGMRRFCLGLTKKVLIANTMAATVDSLYGASLSEVNIAVAWIAALGYLLQIYFDFSGYSDMALGLARMFGFRYKENFNYPYISSSIQEFWRRWHISLSTWFKEYLYIPLGGNRKGKLRGGLNKLVVFFTCGLWHGASWTFVIWGLFHGLFLLLETYLPIKRLPKPLGVVYSLLVVTVGFVLFRAETFEQGFYFISQMFTGFHFEQASTSLALQQLTPLFIVVLIIAIIACTPLKLAIERRVATAKTRIRQLTTAGSYVLAGVLFFICMLSLSSGGYNPFIYFRF